MLSRDEVLEQLQYFSSDERVATEIPTLIDLLRKISPEELKQLTTSSSEELLKPLTTKLYTLLGDPRLEGITQNNILFKNVLYDALLVISHDYPIHTISIYDPDDHLSDDYDLVLMNKAPSKEQLEKIKCTSVITQEPFQLIQYGPKAEIRCTIGGSILAQIGFPEHEFKSSFLQLTEDKPILSVKSSYPPKKLCELDRIAIPLGGHALDGEAVIKLSDRYWFNIHELGKTIN